MVITIEVGELRCIVGDDVDAPDLTELLDAPIQRASSIESIPDGPKRGWWRVDFSPLAEMTGDPKFACCLLELFANRSKALEAEVEWLEFNFLGLE